MTASSSISRTEPASAETTALSLQPISSPAQCSIPADVLTVVLLLTAWLSRFWYSAQFGLYEDDPARVISGMQAPLDVLWRGFLWEWPSQGRPFHPYFIYVFSFVGGKLGGMHGLYWMAYLIFAANVLLLHRLLLKVSGLQAFAATAALGYALFPTDTTQAYLTMSFGGQTSVTFFLLAALAYTSGRRVVGYVLAFASLVTYETVFPLFLAVPLLSSHWDRRLLKKMLRHAALLGAMLAAIAVVRKLGGESQMARLDLQTLLVHPFRQMAIGPAVVVWTFFYRSYQALALAHHLAAYAGIVSCAFIVFTMVLLRLDVPEVLAARKAEPGESSWGIGQASLQSAIWKLVLVGLAMLALAYPIAFTTSASVIDSRDTRGHLPAAIGGAILFGCFCTIALHVSRRGALRSIVRASLAVWLAGLVGFGLTIQNDYLTN